jgi:hypothetical protein
VTLDEWWHSGFDPTPRRLAAQGPPERDPVLTVLKWSGLILLATLLAPFILAAQFLKGFVRL